jgi:hypothetical protein
MQALPTRQRAGDDVAAADDFKIPYADADFSGYGRRFRRATILNRVAPSLGSSVAVRIVGMSEIKGPAIATETFRVEGHCCGIRIPALMDPSSAGVKFEMSPEVRAELLRAGIHAAEDPQDLPRSEEVPEPQADQAPGESAG